MTGICEVVDEIWGGRVNLAAVTDGPGGQERHQEASYKAYVAMYVFCASRMHIELRKSVENPGDTIG